MLLQYPREPLVAAAVRIRPWHSPDDLACIEAAATDRDIPAGTTVPAVFSAAAPTASSVAPSVTAWEMPSPFVSRACWRARKALRELDVLRIEAWVTPENLPSQRVLQHAGFRLEGRLRNFLQLHGRTGDGLVYSRVPGVLTGP